MKKYICLYTLILTLVLHLQTAQANEEYPFISQLENGLTVLIKEDHRFPVVSSRLYVRTGSSNEKSKTLGLAHVLEHMVFKGTKTHPHGIDFIVENAGGSLNAYTTYDRTVYYNDMPSQSWKLSLEAIQGLAFEPLLRQKQLDEERQVVIAELRQRGDMPQTKLLHLSTSSTLHGTPYANPVIGTVETLNAITVKDIQDYIKANYNPNNMLLIVAGDIQKDSVLAEVKKRFGSYKNTSILQNKIPLSLEEIQNLASGIKINIEKGNWNKSYINLSFPACHEASPDSSALLMLSMLLSFDDNALLQQEFIYKEHLVDTISAYPMFFGTVGQFNIYAELEDKNIPQFIDKISKTLAKLSADTFKDSEYEQVRVMLENLYWKKAETIQSIATNYGDNYFSNPTDPLAENALQQIYLTNKENINTVISRYIQPRALNLSCVLPEAAEISRKNIITTIQNNWKSSENTSAKDTQEQKDIEVIEQENKTVVLIQDNHIPFMSVDIRYLGGESLLPFVDTINKEALPSLTAQLLTKGTSKKDYEELTRYLSEKDLYLSASSGTLSFQVSAGGHTRYTKDIIALLAETIKKPAFSKKQLKNIKLEQIAAIQKNNDSVISSMMTKLSGFLFPHHVYGNNKLGTEESVNALTTKDIKKYWEIQKYQRVVISVAGDFNRDEVLLALQDLPEPAPQDLGVTAPAWTTEKALENTVEGRNQDLTLLIFPTVSLYHEDAPALEILSTALDGFNGILYQELREKRNLGYSAFPLLSQSEHTGFLAYGIIAAPEHKQTIQEQFVAITKTLQKNGIDKAAFDRAKASVQMEFINGQQTAKSRASSAANAVLFGRNPNYSQKYLEKMLKVSMDDVNACIKKYLVLEQAYTAHSGSK